MPREKETPAFRQFYLWLQNKVASFFQTQNLWFAIRAINKSGLGSDIDDIFPYTQTRFESLPLPRSVKAMSLLNT